MAKKKRDGKPKPAIPSRCSFPLYVFKGYLAPAQYQL